MVRRRIQRDGLQADEAGLIISLVPFLRLPTLSLRLPLAWGEPRRGHGAARTQWQVVPCKGSGSSVAWSETQSWDTCSRVALAAGSPNWCIGPPSVA